MKRFFALITTGIMLISTFAHAEENPVLPEKDLYEYNNIVARLDFPKEPVIMENHIVFTQKTGPRFVGIAFDFEDYQTIHPFMLHKNRDAEGNVTNSLMFFILERPDFLKEISYRLIVDGLWTFDPNNSNCYYDNESGVTISKIEINETKPEITNTTKESGTKFVYNGKPGQTIRLSGTFTNWDSWIYELKETSPGFYELNIPLPAGEYYYNYYLGMNAIVDTTNPRRAYTADGRTTSVIIVN